MYGCSDAIIIYGFTEDDRENHISYDCSEESGLEMCALDVVRNYMGEAAYGVTCQFDKETGHVIPPSNEEMKNVQDLYRKFMDYHKSKKSSKLGYYLVVAGDYNNCHTSYDLQ